MDQPSFDGLDACVDPSDHDDTVLLDADLDDAEFDCDTDALDDDDELEISFEEEPDDERSVERVRDPLRAAMLARGFTELTSVQVAVLDDACEGRDLSITSQTGSGKTVAVGLVLADALLEEHTSDDGSHERGPRALVVVPTRELAVQLRDELAWLFAGAPSVRIDCVTGGTSVAFERKRLGRAPTLLIGTPGRLLDHASSDALYLGDLRALVLDEADQMLDMGFRDELDAILERTPPTRRTHVMTATFPSGIRALAKRHQVDPLTVEGTRLGEANADIEHLAHHVNTHNRFAALVNTLLLNETDRALVFVNTRADASDVAEQLAKHGFAAMPLSGELAQAARTRTMAAFRAGMVRVLVATDVAARGIDIPEVDLVVHAGAAYDTEVFVHRSGRTGRAGRAGRSVLFVPAKKERRIRSMIREAGVAVRWASIPTADEVNDELARRQRAAAAEAVDAATDLDPKAVERARELLAGRDPAIVVATLLDRAERGDVAPLEFERPRARDREDERNRHGHDGGDSGSRRPFRASGPGANDDGQDFVRFSINWGTRAGATPKRILAHCCRRGGITNASVGAIRLHERESTIDVRLDVAQDFEERTRTRDRRDPHLRIERSRPYRGGSQRQDDQRRRPNDDRPAWSKNGGPRRRHGAMR